MKVILLDEIKGKGGEGDVVEVAQGYAENFLFPKKLAVAATKGNLKQLDERRNNIAKREAVRLATANETKAALEGKTVTVDVKVGDEGILFGSVTAAMIADAIKAQLGMDIDRKRVELGKPIKVAGAHTVAISLYREIKAEVVVLVGVTAEELAAEAEVEEAAEVAEAETAEKTKERSSVHFGAPLMGGLTRRIAILRRASKPRKPVEDGGCAMAHAAQAVGHSRCGGRIFSHARDIRRTPRSSKRRPAI